MVALHTAVAIVLAVGLILWLKVDPVISLLLASLYLGLASGVGFTGTIEAIAAGFGEIMAEVGLLIGFGVLIGAFLHAAGAFQRLLNVFVRVVGATRLPYALSMLHCAACGRHLIGDTGYYRYPDACDAFRAAAPDWPPNLRGRRDGKGYPRALYEDAIGKVLERVAIGADVFWWISRDHVATSCPR